MVPVWILAFRVGTIHSSALRLMGPAVVVAQKVRWFAETGISIQHVQIHASLQTRTGQTILTRHVGLWTSLAVQSGRARAIKIATQLRRPSMIAQQVPSVSTMCVKSPPVW